MKLSVVVPFYNVAAYLRQCLESLADQTLSDLQIILVDDGSRDASRAIADEFVASDERFVLVAQDNAGLGPARNAGAALARGDYLTFVDSDDIVPRRAFETATRRLDRSGADFLAGGALRFNAHGTRASWLHSRVFDADSRRATIVDNPGLAADRMIWNKVYRKAFWDAGRYEFPAIRYEDYPVTLQTYADASHVEVCVQPMYLWRERDDAGNGSITQQYFELDNVEDRVDSGLRTLTIAESLHPEARLVVHDHLATIDLPALARAVAHPGNAAHRTLIVQAASDLVTRLDATALAARSPWERLLHWLMAQQDGDTLARLVLAREDGAVPLARRRPGRAERWHLTLPGTDLGDLAPPTALRIRPDEVAVRGVVLQSHTSGTQFVLRLSVTMGCPLEVGTQVECWLARPDGSAPVVAASVENVQIVDLAEARLDVVVDAHALADASTTESSWGLHVRVRDRSATRSGAVEMVREPGVNVSQPIVLDAWTWLQAGRHDGAFVIRVLRPPVVVDDARIEVEGEIALSGRSRIPLDGDTSLELASRAAGTSRRVPVLVDTRSDTIPGAGTRWWARIPVSAFTGQHYAQHPFDDRVRWTMSLLTETRKAQPRLSPDLPELRIPNRDQELTIAANRFHAVYLPLTRRRFLLTEVAVEPERILLSGAWPTAVSAAHALILSRDEEGEEVRIDGHHADGTWQFDVDLTRVATAAGDITVAHDAVWSVLVEVASERHPVYLGTPALRRDRRDGRIGDRFVAVEAHRQFATRLRVSARAIL